MSDRDTFTADALDRLVPQPAGSGDWDAVVRDARPRRARRITALAVPVAVLVAVAALALLWPFGGGDRPGILDRALAAVGDGPVVHVVLRGDWGGTEVDLRTGARTPVYGESEIWYDRDRGLVHNVSRLGGAVEYESVAHPTKSPPDLAALASEYRDALEQGTARVAEEGSVAGESVYWIVYRQEMLPDVADHRDHEFSEQVAVSKSTFEPVGLRSTRDGVQGPGTLQYVVELETLPAGAGDFDASPRNEVDGLAFGEGKEPATLAAAPAILGARPLWLGHRYGDLPLGEIAKTTRSTGRVPEVELHGQAAEDVRECLGQEHGRAGRFGPACERMRAAGIGGVSVHDGRVYATKGKVQWRQDTVGLSLFYGTIDDDPGTYRDDPRPDFRKPYVWVTESTERDAAFQRTRGYTPTEGSIFLSAGGNGFLQRDGLYVTIQASSDEEVLAAARALELMS